MTKSIMRKRPRIQRNPSYPLKDIKRVFRDHAALNMSVSAADGADSLGFTDYDVVEVIQMLGNQHFDKTMQADKNPRNMQDVYKVFTDRLSLYVKFTIDHDGDFLLVSFKENDDA